MTAPLRAHANAPIRTRRLGLALGGALIALPLSAQASDEAPGPPPAPAEAPPSKTKTEPEPQQKQQENQSPPVESRPIAASGDVACPPCATAPPPSKIRWRDEWPRVTLWEHTLAALFGAGALAALQIKPNDTGRWQNG